MSHISHERRFLIFDPRLFFLNPDLDLPGILFSPKEVPPKKILSKIIIFI